MFSFKHHKATSLTAALVLAGTAAAALAAGTVQPAKAEALQQSRVRAVQAVDIAVQKAGGRAYGVEFEHKNGKSYFEVDVAAADGQRHEITVDAAAGRILADKIEHGHEKGALPQAAVSLNQAVEAALAKTGGIAKEAGLKSKNGQTYYKVETLANGQEYDVAVNPQNGAVMSAAVDQDD